MKRQLEKKDLSRLIGAVMILLGRIVLVAVFFFLCTFIAYGTPTTVTPARLSVFLNHMMRIFAATERPPSLGRYHTDC